MNADANLWSTNFAQEDLSAETFGMIFHTRVTAKELAQYFPPVKKSDLPRKVWSRVDAIRRTIESGGELTFAIHRRTPENIAVLGCALQLAACDACRIIISSMDPCLRYDGIGVKGAPKLKLLNSLTRQGRKQLLVLRQKATFGQMSTEEQQEFGELDELDSLEQWYIEFKDGDGSQPVSARYAQQDAPAAD